MAAEIEFVGSTGKVHYALVRNATGSIWNGTGFVAYATAGLSTYAISATEQGTASSFFTATFPAAAAGVYNVIAKERAGGSPAETDVTVAEGDLQWNGTLVESLFGLIDDFLGRSVATIEGTAAIQSLCSAILKLTGRFDVNVGANAVTYRTDGVTAHMTQARTNNAALTPIQRLGVGT